MQAVIRSFKNKTLQAQFEAGGKRFGAQSAKIDELLDFLDASTSIRALIALKHFHALGGVRKGTYAVNVTKNWRLTFKFKDGDAFDVHYEDYH